MSNAANSTETAGGAGTASTRAMPPLRTPTAMPRVPTLVSPNPLIRAAWPLLSLAIRLRDTTDPPDIKSLRQEVLREIKAFPDRAAEESDGQMTQQTIRVARYLVAATIDDLVLSTPWGAHSIWSQHGMVSSVYKETWGGERFFDILYALHQDPRENLPVLELIYHCLAIGFTGKFRLVTQGRSELKAIRDALYQTLRSWREPEDRVLALNWQGIDTRGEGRRPPMPVWFAWAGALGLLAAVYLSMATDLELQSRSAAEAIAGMPPTTTIAITTPPLPILETPLDRVRKALSAEIDDGHLSVDGDSEHIEIRIKGDAMFASAAAAVLPDLEPLIKKIGEALKPESGPITVYGYTDSLPIRTRRFPNNTVLSEARAASVASIIGATIGDTTRVRAEGKGDADPIASNATEAGRAANRRIEVVLKLNPSPVRNSVAPGDRPQ